MKRLSRLTALLLALVLMLSSGLSAVAESISTQAAYYAAARAALNRVIMNSASYDDYWDLVSLIDDEDFDEFFLLLTETEQQAMADYILPMFWDACISYTDVGPFLPPVDVTETAAASVYSRSLLTTASRSGTVTTEDQPTDPDNNGVFLKKTAVENSDGSYTVTLETYVGATVTTTTETETVPCDIVLVLDVSTSMKESFGTTTRLAALQTAVSNFLESVKNNSEKNNNVGHRVAIVTYNKAATTRAYLRRIDSTSGYSQLTSASIQYDDSGTHTDYGLANAHTIFNTNDATALQTSATTALNDPVKAGEETRSRVVVLFTDGYPTTSGSDHFDCSYAKSAIENAYTLKNTDNATVYAVAVLKDASPTGTITNQMTNGNDPAIGIVNAYLHAVSSNYKQATVSDSYYITLGDGGNNGYYLTADSPENLNNIFQSISTSIDSATATINLGSTTVIQDVISPYFKLPDEVIKAIADDSSKLSDYVTVTEAAYTGTVNGETTWGTSTASSATVSLVASDTENKTIQVTGFDFSANAVYSSSDGKNHYGKKLIITFNVEAEDDFIGGNNVITNDSDNSGVYTPGTDSDGNPTLDEVEEYPLPDVDNVVKIIKPIIKDDYIYISNAADLTKLIGKEGDYYTFTLTYYTKNSDGSLTLGETTGPWKIDGTNNDYVDIVYTFATEDGIVLATMEIEAGKTTGELVYTTAGQEFNKYLTEDTDIVVTCDVTPTAEGEYKASQDVQTHTIFVYKPVMTFVDEEVEYNKTAGKNAIDFYNEEDWKDNLIYWEGNYRDADGNIVAKTITAGSTTVATGLDKDGNTVVIAAMSGTEPDDFTLTYEATKEDETTSYTWLDANNIVIGQEDVYVNVTKVESTNADGASMDITAYTKRIRKDCNVNNGCDHTDETAYIITTADPDFVIHIYNVYGSLTIKKTFSEGTTPNNGETFLFTVNGPDGFETMDIVIAEAGEVTLSPLPVGTYTVTEDTAWSWRYEPEGSAVQTATVSANGNTTVTFTNKLSTNQWLDDSAYADNNFNGSTSTTTDNTGTNE